MALIPEIIKRVTPPEKTATKCLNEEKTPSISIITPPLAKLQEGFEPGDSDLPIISEMKDKFRHDCPTSTEPHHSILGSKTSNSRMMTTLETVYSYVQDCSQCPHLPFTCAFIVLYLTEVFGCTESIKLSVLIISKLLSGRG